MKNQKMLCLYHPSTVVIVDDDEIFLKNIALKLTLDIPYKTYQDPNLALTDLKAQNAFLSHLSKEAVYKQIVKDETDSVDFKISSIYENAYNQKQFSGVSVIIVDYSMAKMNGAELLENLTDYPIKKIMLTGQADEALAVKLFNDGIIDKFILKGSQSLQKTLNESITSLQKKYFEDLSNSILKRIPERLDCFSDTSFNNFFHQLLVAFSVSSYYLIDTSGSFLFLDTNASPTWFLVKSMDEMREFSMQADSEGAPQNIVNLLKSGEKMAYFGNFDDYLNATSGNWEKYLHPTKKFTGDKEYVYVITKNLPEFPLDQNKILSFDSYLRSGLSAQNII